MRVKNENGFTLVELIIVLAIIAILGAIIVPNFISTTDKARLKSDVQSARVIQSAFELYDAEQAVPITKTDMAAALIKLKEAQYLSAKGLTIQTAGARWEFASAEKVVVVNITGCDQKIKDTANQLSAEEKSLIK